MRMIPLMVVLVSLGSLAAPEAILAQTDKEDASRQPQITEVSTDRLLLRNDGQSAQLTLSGRYLDRITAVQVLHEGRVASGVTATLQPERGGQRSIVLRADTRVSLGEYDVRLLAGAQEIRYGGGVRLTVEQALVETGAIDPRHTPGPGQPVRGNPPPPAPVQPIGISDFRIDNGAAHTLQQTVQLDHDVTGPHTPTHYRACEGCDLQGTAWKPYASAPQFNLSPGDGVKTINLQLKAAPIASPDGGAAVANESEIRTASILFLLGERCFGAVGMECAIAACTGPNCMINGGSWEHDQCCWAEKVKGSGKSCGSVTAPVAEVCAAEWSKALSRTSSLWSWVRTVDTTHRNTTGKVEFADYCALTGSRVHKDDAKYCCSKSAIAPSVPDLPDARICS